nr:bifunctional proline dehydrogenase/L-glutamate gamma-semialdehyde dehydrogenase PutA [Oleiagrimonas sp. C23AA]
MPPAPSGARQHITAAWLRDETEAVHELLDQASFGPNDRRRVVERARDIVKRVRAKADDQSPIEAFMRQYDLSSEEGILLMCVAEALLRIPDALTTDRLIRDKLGNADWRRHMGSSTSMFVNASTWGLMITGRLVHVRDKATVHDDGTLHSLIRRFGEPVVRRAVRQAMRILGVQFVMGQTIEEALKRSHEKENRAYRYSFDMLGEAAITQQAADDFMQAYRDAIDAIGKHSKGESLVDGPSISVKLSALHPRYEHIKRDRVHQELTPKLLELAQRAKAAGIALSVDAEESERLEISLEVIGKVYEDPSLDGWDGFGIVVQAYQKRAPFVIDWVAEQARRVGRRWHMRLVKGAYWDSEIKRAQEQGLPGYPVYTRKPNTDVSYLACARRMFEAGEELIYPQFATHNAHTISALYEMANGRPYEYQRLHGMGSDLYNEVIGEKHLNIPCRVYAPVGSHEELLPYLVRRLLENGANTSFVNLILNPRIAISDLVADPCLTVRAFDSIPHPRIPMPATLYGDLRKNSMGINFANDNELRSLAEAVNKEAGPWNAEPLVPGAKSEGDWIDATDPSDRRRHIGKWLAADEATVKKSLENALACHGEWDRRGAEERAQILEKAADLLEERRARFVAMCVREAGKSLSASIAEVREAEDFLRYYATMARRLMGKPEKLPGPTGETNTLTLHGRGVFVCISPWNFPLAIFTGQISAALVSGNAVIAKPAEQTAIIGYEMAKLLHDAGVPKDVLQFVPGDGATVGANLTKDERIAGVAFTGSTGTAHAINRSLAARETSIAALIAETGGQNAMVADSSALPEQLVKDVIYSAFDSAGQRCSATRVLFLQEEVADRVLEMLAGAVKELKVGDPGLLSTDVGPVIDNDAMKMLVDHAERMDKEAKLVCKATLTGDTDHGTFFEPRVYEVDKLSDVGGEVFGPVLHVVRYKASELDKMLKEINDTGYGLTLGIHSRVEDTAEYISERIQVGNSYVNRNQIGAVVGVQPFGGEGLSGTGPKAGGPHYLLRFITERVLTVNTTAAGGNASLLTLSA